MPRLTTLALTFACTALSCTETDKDSSSANSSGNSSGSSAATTATSSDTGGASQTEAGPTTQPEPTSGDSSSATATASTGATNTTGVAAVSFTEVYEQVLLPNGCNAGYCHGGAAGGLEMTDEATSYANLVEVKAAAMLCDQTVRVVPGSLAESILWLRVRPAAQDAMTPCATGNKMPKGSMGLSDAEAQLVEDWIVGGALE